FPSIEFLGLFRCQRLLHGTHPDFLLFDCRGSEWVSSIHNISEHGSLCNYFDTVAAGFLGGVPGTKSNPDCLAILTIGVWDSFTMCDLTDPLAASESFFCWDSVGVTARSMASKCVAIACWAAGFFKLI
ncbi:MAG: hypothetical protein ACI814_004210, partial [Mariniblastus sp.]